MKDDKIYSVSINECKGYNEIIVCLDYQGAKVLCTYDPKRLNFAAKDFIGLTEFEALRLVAQTIRLHKKK